MKTYLNISFGQKDTAKAEAAQNNTRIQWDATSKRWFWEGEGNLPSFLEKYSTSKAEAENHSIEYIYVALDILSSPTSYWVRWSAILDRSAPPNMKKIFEEVSHSLIIDGFSPEFIEENLYIISSRSKVSVGKHILPKFHSFKFSRASKFEGFSR